MSEQNDTALRTRIFTVVNVSDGRNFTQDDLARITERGRETEREISALMDKGYEVDTMSTGGSEGTVVTTIVLRLPRHIVTVSGDNGVIATLDLDAMDGAE